MWPVLRGVPANDSTSRAGGHGIFQLCSVRAKTQDGQLAEKTFQKSEELKSMSTVTKTNTEGESIGIQKRVILSMGGKGGVGKTSVIARASGMVPGE